LNERYDSVELFVYTASQKDWASVLIEAIEKEYKITINKPLFTRKDCLGINKKSLNKILPVIKRKIPDVNNSDMYKVLMVDNNNVLDKTESSFLVKCPSYEKRIERDILKSLPEIYISEHYKELIKTLSYYNLLEEVRDSNLLSHFYSSYYANLSKVYKNKSKHRVKDTFWSEFAVSH
jgi:hypothetical protein